MKVAKLFGVTRQALVKLVKAYREGGANMLKAKQRARPKGGSFFPWQEAQIAKTIVERRPEQLKLPFYLWTREAVGAVD